MQLSSVNYAQSRIWNLPEIKYRQMRLSAESAVNDTKIKDCRNCDSRPNPALIESCFLMFNLLLKRVSIVYSQQDWLYAVIISHNMFCQILLIANHEILLP